MDYQKPRWIAGATMAIIETSDPKQKIQQENCTFGGFDIFNWTFPLS